ncbi:hypothetical protein ABZV67_44725 [Streptomyces sp. NPDC005065]|uniref:hypothetical protein n=1 Tax=unclassified Streptomyces TaxID=2593676 RepID=UPI0033B59A11
MSITRRPVERSRDSSRDITHKLPRDTSFHQELLLRTIAGPFLERGVWPTWHFVQRIFDNRDLDATEVLRSLPRVGAHSRTYGFTGPIGPAVNDADQVRLTIAASVVIPEFEMMVGTPFVRTLRHLIKVYSDTPFTPDGVTHATLRSEDLRRAIPSLPAVFLDNFVDLVRHEPGISLENSNIPPEGGSWTIGFSRSVLRYRKVTTVSDYVDAECAFAAEWAQELLPAAPVPELEHVRGPYIDLGLLADLEAAGETSAWSLDKLLGLALELNSNYSASHPYSCQALIRAIIDHIPPAFGQPGFAGVVSSHKWGSKTDRDHAKRLSEYRTTGDDVMHRQIRNDPGLITMDDLPPRTQLNAVLRELLLVLRDDAGSGSGGA